MASTAQGIHEHYRADVSELHRMMNVGESAENVRRQLEKVFAHLALDAELPGASPEERDEAARMAYRKFLQSEFLVESAEPGDLSAVAWYVDPALEAVMGEYPHSVGKLSEGFRAAVHMRSRLARSC